MFIASSVEAGILRSDLPGRNALPTGSDVNLSRGFQTTSGTDPGIASPSDVAERFVSQPAERTPRS